MNKNSSISITAYHRITRYLNYLTKLPADGDKYISATIIADALTINNVVVRKDLSIVSGNGKPKIGYVRADLISDIESFLGHNNCMDSVLVGVGHLGKSLLFYKNFEKYGLNIIAAFETSPELIGTAINKTKILASSEIANLCKRLQVKIGIITVPDSAAQEVCNALIEGGVRAIWNFAPCELKVPDGISVKYEDVAASIAILTKQLTENTTKKIIGGN